MTHILKDKEVWGLVKITRPWVAVCVQKVKANEVVVAGGIDIVKAGATLAPLPDRIKVVSSEGDVLRPERGRFYITTETIDPYHLICDGLPSTE